MIYLEEVIKNKGKYSKRADVQTYKEVYYKIFTNYVFSCFLIDILPNYISYLIKNRGMFFVKEDKINITFKILTKGDFNDTKGILANSEMIWKKDNQNLIVYFKDKKLIPLFIEKFNEFLSKNRIIYYNKIIKNYINYGLPLEICEEYVTKIDFSTFINNLIKAYENGLEEIKKEKDSFKELMNAFNITDENILASLNVNSDDYSKKRIRK